MDPRVSAEMATRTPPPHADQWQAQVLNAQELDELSDHQRKTLAHLSTLLTTGKDEHGNVLSATKRKLYLQRARFWATRPGVISALVALFAPYADLLLTRETMTLTVAMRVCRLREHLDQSPTLSGTALQTFNEGLALADLAAAQDSLPMAFAEHPRQMQCILMTDYADQVLCSPDALSALRTNCVCLLIGTRCFDWHGPTGDPRCLTMACSARWVRRHEHPAAKGQRWYCPVCDTRYRQKWGTLVELVVGGQSYWAKADMPPGNWWDFKACLLYTSDAADE